MPSIRATAARRWSKRPRRGESWRDRIRRERTDALNLALDGLDERERSQIEAALPVLERLAEDCG